MLVFPLQAVLIIWILRRVRKVYWCFWIRSWMWFLDSASYFFYRNWTRLGRLSISDLKYGYILFLISLLTNLNQMSPTCSANRREIRQFKIWKDLLHLRTKVLSPKTLETIEGRAFSPASEYRSIGDGAASGGGEEEGLDFSCPSGIKEKRDWKSFGYRRRWQDTVEWGDVETWSETIEDVSNCKVLR